MVVRNIIAALFVIVAVSFAQSADTTEKRVISTQTSTSEVASKRSNSSLKKQQRVVKPATTWSKIKDLFM